MFSSVYFFFRKSILTLKSYSHQLLSGIDFGFRISCRRNYKHVVSMQNAIFASSLPFDLNVLLELKQLSGGDVKLLLLSNVKFGFHGMLRLYANALFFSTM